MNRNPGQPPSLRNTGSLRKIRDPIRPPAKPVPTPFRRLSVLQASPLIRIVYSLPGFQNLSLHMILASQGATPPGIGLAWEANPAGTTSGRGLRIPGDLAP